MWPYPSYTIIKGRPVAQSWQTPDLWQKNPPLTNRAPSKEAWATLNNTLSIVSVYHAVLTSLSCRLVLSSYTSSLIFHNGMSAALKVAWIRLWREHSRISGRFQINHSHGAHHAYLSLVHMHTDTCTHTQTHACTCARTPSIHPSIHLLHSQWAIDWCGAASCW